MSAPAGPPIPAAIHRLADTPFSVIDLETTGLTASDSAILEVAVVRLEPGAEPVVVLDTLVNPESPVRGTRIHGIVDDEVIGAPTFAQVAPLVADAIAGSVVLAYNAAFDLSFLETYGGSAGLVGLPYLCLMWMRQHLDLGRRCSLEEACLAHGVQMTGAHTARGDALAEAGLWHVYAKRLGHAGVQVLGELQLRAGRSKYAQSLLRPLPVACAGGRSLVTPPLKPRVPSPKYLPNGSAAVRYRRALSAYLADGALNPMEIEALARIAAKLYVTRDEMNDIHREALDADSGIAGNDQPLSPATREWLQGQINAERLAIRLEVSLPPPPAS